MVRKTWSFNTLQIKDFVIMPDQKSIVAGTTSLKRVAIESKLKQAVSTLDAANVAGLPRDFGYGAMEHNLVTIRLGDKEIIEYVVLPPRGVGYDADKCVSFSWSHDLRRSVTSLSLSWDKKRILLSAGPVSLAPCSQLARLLIRLCRRYNCGALIRHYAFCAGSWGMCIIDMSSAAGSAPPRTDSS